MASIAENFSRYAQQRLQYISNTNEKLLSVHLHLS